MSQPEQEFRVEPHASAYVIGELIRHNARKRKIDWIKSCIALARPPVDDVGGGRSGPGNPTLRTVIEFGRDDELQDLEDKVRKVEAALTLLTESERQVVKALYIDRLYTVTGAARVLKYSERHTRRLKATALYQIGMVLGVVKA